MIHNHVLYKFYFDISVDVLVSDEGPVVSFYDKKPIINYHI